VPNNLVTCDRHISDIVIARLLKTTNILNFGLAHIVDPHSLRCQKQSRLLPKLEDLPHAHIVLILLHSRTNNNRMFEFKNLVD
jgi:hypothetical protein